VNPAAHVPLAPFTSLRVGGAADRFVLARTADELAQALDWAQQHALPVRVIGGGSNLLIAEDGVEGLVIKTANAQSEVVERDGQSVLIAEAGATLANLARRLAKQGWSGLEWAANVPGTVGGAAVNNAGAFGGETAECLVGLVSVDASGRRRRLESAELDYAYRTSVLKRRQLGDVAVETVELAVARADAAETAARVKGFNAQRMRSQPRGLSAGSVFANPAGDFAGRLLEAAGLKLAQYGGAQISDVHANFIVNPGGATASDVYRLMRHAQDVVFDQTGIWLRPEIELFGRWSAEQRAALLGPAVAQGRGHA
jgi:UDP-N-acetylmuramate dehydrogenase